MGTAGHPLGSRAPMSSQVTGGTAWLLPVCLSSCDCLAVAQGCPFPPQPGMTSCCVAWWLWRVQLAHRDKSSPLNVWVVQAVPRSGDASGCVSIAAHQQMPAPQRRLSAGWMGSAAGQRGAGGSLSCLGNTKQ